METEQSKTSNASSKHVRLKRLLCCPIYDKNGREIKKGDTLKVFHFQADGDKYFMYKFVKDEVFLGHKKAKYLKISHLNLKGSHYHLLLDGKKHEDIEIVQGYGEEAIPFYERQKVK